MTPPIPPIPTGERRAASRQAWQGLLRRFVLGATGGAFIALGGFHLIRDRADTYTHGWWDAVPLVLMVLGALMIWVALDFQDKLLGVITKILDVVLPWRKPKD